MSESTNPTSKFIPFTLPLPNSTVLTGISHIPSQTSSFPPPLSLPLLIGLHGGTCTSHYFDVSPSHTASTASLALSIPFVAINRPGYLGSTPLSIPEGSSFQQETGKALHSSILPALWAEFGLPNGCTGVVLTCHSIAVPSAIVAAGLHADEPENSAYPLAGLIFTGWGSRHTVRPEVASQKPEPPAHTHLLTSPALKAKMMLGEEADGCGDFGALGPLLGVSPQNVGMPLEEPMDVHLHWEGYRRVYMERVSVPVMYAMGERDWLWEANGETMEEFRRGFPRCPRWDGSLVLGASHALEWGWVGEGFYVRCFGWAMEVCAAARGRGRG